MFAERRLAFQDIRNRKSLNEVAFLTGKCCKLLEEVFPDRALYPNFYRALAIPFTQSSCERSFSKLNLLKKKIRSTMSDTRLNSLMIGYSERDVIEVLVTDEMDSLVTLFAGLNPGKERRINL